MNIYCIADDTLSANEEFNAIHKLYPQIIFDLPQHYDQESIVIILGGDGFMLYNLHKYMHKPFKFFGMNCGTVGFLMNDFSSHNLIERIKKADQTIIHPLQMTIHTADGETHKMLAINEACLFRHTHQAAHLKIDINNKTKIEEMVADGILVSTPAGSSAYNSSAGGPIIPFTSNLLALTPLNSYKPRRWTGALIPDNSIIHIEVLNHQKRPINASADFKQIENIKYATISQQNQTALTLLFDPGHSLEERIINEQFIV